MRCIFSVRREEVGGRSFGMLFCRKAFIVDRGLISDDNALALSSEGLTYAKG